MRHQARRPYVEQTLDNLKSLEELSADHIAEHLALYARHVKQVNMLKELAVLREKGRASGPITNSRS